MVALRTSRMGSPEGGMVALAHCAARAQHGAAMTAQAVGGGIGQEGTYASGHAEAMPSVT
ncbi:hypothetical protein [Paraburkholderia sp. GAS42]|uniref:hypothetical protein n=1 Tax=Paraburkholderia sp. GAS42 TaxID=3035135 RepID=UPI003D21104C